MRNKIYSIMVITIIMATLAGCKKENASAPMAVESLTAIPGRYRAQVEFDAPADAKTGKVFYGGGNFTEFTVTDPGSLQKVIVEDLTEQEQTLRVVTINSDGLVSDPRAVKVKVYGSKYESGLKPRKWLDQVTNSASSLEFKFNNTIQGETGVRVMYTNTGGNPDSVTMNSNENSIAIDNIDTTKPYYYYSVYKPEAASIDEFFSSPVDLKTALMLDFKKDNWTIAGASGEDAEHAASMIIDNDANTSWNSGTAAVTPWLTIDMESPKYIDGFYYLNHPGDGSGAKQLKFEISTDNTSWTTALQADVSESYFRQQLALPQTVIARYIRISVLETRSAKATQAAIGEIDAYNIQNISSDNGYTTSSPVALVNAKFPFTGDGSNPFPALGEYRMQKLAGWTHSANAIVSYDNLSTSMSLFIAPVWGLPAVTNGKIYQAVDIQPGNYILKIMPGSSDGPTDVLALVSTDAALPDYANVPGAASTIGYADLMEYQEKSVELRIVATQAMKVYIGLVYNLRSQYNETGLPWTSLKIKEFNLVKDE